MDYDDIAEAYDAYASDAITDTELGYKSVAYLLRATIRGGKILDYGCGNGKSSRFLRSKGAQVVGVDISRKEINIAKTYNDGIEYHVIEDGAIAELPSDFDAVVLCFVLCAISSMEEIEAVLTASRSKVVSGGQIVILTDHVEKSMGREFVSFAIPHLLSPKSGDPLCIKLGKNRALEVGDYYWTQSDYHRALERTGFLLEEIFEPIATEGDGWRDETTHPPFLLLSARAR